MGKAAATLLHKCFSCVFEVSTCVWCFSAAFEAGPVITSLLLRMKRRHCKINARTTGMHWPELEPDSAMLRGCYMIPASPMRHYNIVPIMIYICGVVGEQSSYRMAAILRSAFIECEDLRPCMPALVWSPTRQCCVPLMMAMCWVFSFWEEGV
jgi:hypothetical protein